MYEIEKGHQLDPRQQPRRNQALKSALERLATAEIGDSILVKDMKRESLYARRKDWGLPLGVFSMRVVEGGVRVWKIAHPTE